MSLTYYRSKQGGAMPSRKWWAATVTGIGTEVVAVLEAGWNKATQIALVGLVVQRAVAYIVRNEPNQ